MLDQNGNTVIITGANSGLGNEATREYWLGKEAKVIMAVRNLNSLSKDELIAQRLWTLPEKITGVSY